MRISEINFATKALSHQGTLRKLRVFAPLWLIYVKLFLRIQFYSIEPVFFAK